MKAFITGKPVLYHVICIGKPNYVPVWKISSTKLVLSVSVLSFSAAITFTQYLVLSEEEGQQHQHASIVDDPPHINVTLSEALSIGREGCDVLRDKQSQVSSGGFSDQLCRTDTNRERGQSVS